MMVDSIQHHHFQGPDAVHAGSPSHCHALLVHLLVWMSSTKKSVANLQFFYIQLTLWTKYYYIVSKTS